MRKYFDDVIETTRFVMGLAGWGGDNNVIAITHLQKGQLIFQKDWGEFDVEASFELEQQRLEAGLVIIEGKERHAVALEVSISGRKRNKASVAKIRAFAQNGMQRGGTNIFKANFTERCCSTRFLFSHV